MMGLAFGAAADARVAPASTAPAAVKASRRVTWAILIHSLSRKKKVGTLSEREAIAVSAQVSTCYRCDCLNPCRTWRLRRWVECQHTPRPFLRPPASPHSSHVDYCVRRDADQAEAAL